jgi:hypothetical protein
MNFKPNLANEFAYATECNLATLSGLLLKKRSPKNEIERQTNICLRMLVWCRLEKAVIEWGSPVYKNFGRVEKLVAETDLPTALKLWVLEHKA